MARIAKARGTRPADRPPVYVPGLDGDGTGPLPTPSPSRRKWIAAGGIGGFVLLVIALGNMGGGDTQSGTTPVATTVTKTVTSTVAGPPLTIAAQAPVATVTVTEAAPPAAFVAPPVPQEPPPVYVEAPPLPSVEMSPPSAHYASCSAARAAGAAPLHAGQPGYSSKLDRDGDGVACE